MLEFPRWKYVVILLVLLASIVYSLPNLYPKDPSVQVTANRGAATGTRVCDLLFELNRDLQTTVVLVTHDHVLAGRCARALHMDAGRLV